jgi:hypothetical protein
MADTATTEELVEGLRVCEGCDELVSDEEVEEVGPLYECCQTFTRQDSHDGDSNRCPSCFKFAAKVAEEACPHCSGDEFRPATQEDVDRKEAEEREWEEKRAARAKRGPDPIQQRIQSESDERRAKWKPGAKYPEAFRGITDEHGNDVADYLAKIMGGSFASTTAQVSAEVWERIARRLLGEEQDRDDAKSDEAAG